MPSRIAVLGVALGVVASGCGFNSDGGRDGGGGSDACVSFAKLLDTCKLAFDGDLTVMGTVTYDTTNHMFMVAAGAEAPVVTHTTVTLSGDEVDVISARNVRITMSSKLRGMGMRPLAIVASDTLTIEADAQIDVSAGGAGAQILCGASAAMPGQSSGIDPNDGGAGGGGGGYGADGGNGGNGNQDGAAQTQGGMKGPAVGSVPTGLRGGCPGANGGSGDVQGGAGGAGGGALYVAAANRIDLNSLRSITAGGGGGAGGQHNGGGGNAGGGGGGSGGMLILEAPTIMGMNATIAANGGGGGEGSDGGNAGDDGDPGAISTSRANGGGGNANDGADGGRGGSRDEPTGESVTTAVPKGGGGGGGGGVGFILIVSPDVQGVTTSPDRSS